MEDSSEPAWLGLCWISQGRIFQRVLHELSSLWDTYAWWPAPLWALDITCPISSFERTISLGYMGNMETARCKLSLYTIYHAYSRWSSLTTKVPHPSTFWKHSLPFGMVPSWRCLFKLCSTHMAAMWCMFTHNSCLVHVLWSKRLRCTCFCWEINLNLHPIRDTQNHIAVWNLWNIASDCVRKQERV